MRKQIPNLCTALAELHTLVNTIRASDNTVESDLAYIQFVNILTDVASHSGILIGAVLRESDARHVELRRRRAAERAVRERARA